MKLKQILMLPTATVWHALFWTFERATWQYDLMVLTILAFIWITPPGWLADPTAQGPGLIGLIAEFVR